MSAPNRMYVDGEWVAAADGGELAVIDPATEETVDGVPVATSADLDRALAAAERGWHEWRETDAWTRSRTVRRVAEWIFANRETIAGTMTEEQGKPLAEAVAEVQATGEQFDWYADEARRIYGRVVEGHARTNRITVLRQPIGPVAAFSAWNFPALLPGRKIAPALATGCSIVVKPASEAPRTALWLARACEEAGVPAGVVNVVTGNAARISEHLIGSEIIRKVSLTGSVEVGRRLLELCAPGIKAITMELGGHAPVLVFADADVGRAAEVCVLAKFRNCGQVCISPSRFFVQEAIADEFESRVVELARSIRIGPGSDPDTELGPLANRRRLETVEALIADALAKGAALCYGGKRPGRFERGFFYEPTVLTDVDSSMAVMTEEPFGPIAPIARFSDLEDGLRQANATRFGLAGYVFTHDLKTAQLASERLEVGMVGVNNLVIATAEAPFGGVKQSGFGREGGSEGIESYTVAKYVNTLL